MQIGDPQSFNRYAYVGNDPVNRIDPSGLDFCGAQYSQCSDIFHPIPERGGLGGMRFSPHMASAESRYEIGVHFSYIPENARYIGGLTWGWTDYAHLSEEGDARSYSYTFNENRLRSLTFWGGEFAFESGGVVRDVYGHVAGERGLDMHPAFDPVWIGAGIAAGGVIGGMRGAAARALSAEVVQAFEGPIHRIILQRSVYAYRYWGGVSGRFGRWLTNTNTVVNIGSGSARAALNLPAGATSAHLERFIIPKGTEIFVGRVASGAPWATQIYVRNPSVLVPAGP